MYEGGRKKDEDVQHPCPSVTLLITWFPRGGHPPIMDLIPGGFARKGYLFQAGAYNVYKRVGI